jgi:hypothetical protein
MSRASFTKSAVRKSMTASAPRPAEHRAAVHAYVDPVGHEDGHRPELDGGVDSGDMLAGDSLLHLEVTVTQN